MEDGEVGVNDHDENGNDDEEEEYDDDDEDANDEVGEEGMTRMVNIVLMFLE